MLALRAALFAITLAVTLVLGICENDDKEPVEPLGASEAVQAAALQLGDSRSEIPIIGTEYDCIISASGPQSSGITPVNARCRYDAEEQGEQWIVTFREIWFCSDFSATADGYPPCVGLTGFHEWKFLVDLVLGTVQQIDESGQFAPDLIR